MMLEYEGLVKKAISSLFTTCKMTSDILLSYYMYSFQLPLGAIYTHQCVKLQTVALYQSTDLCWYQEILGRNLEVLSW